MVPGMTEREGRIANAVRLEWLTGVQNGPARFHVVSKPPHNSAGPHRGLLPRSRFRGLWPALMLRLQPRMVQLGAIERALS
jgi:hypothetical protein